MFSMTRALPVALAVFLGVIGGAAGAAPAPSAVTPALVEAACKEGKVVWYTSAELTLVHQIAKAFEAKHPCLSVQVERSGAERNFQRLGQEYASGIHSADVVESSDAAHFVVWKRQGWLAPYLPEEVAKYFPPQYYDPDGSYAIFRVTLSVMGYNTNLVKAADAPKSFADLLDPKWSGKIVKAHPGYSGTILTATYAIVRELGWPYLEKLAKQKVLQKQSATEPPKQIAQGERAIMADGIEYLLLSEKKKGAPVEPIYPSEGTPLILGGLGIMKDAPHPNAARLYSSYLLSLEAQQMIVDVGSLRSVHKLVKEPAGRPALKDIKTFKDDPEGSAAHADEIKKTYARIFGV